MATVITAPEADRQLETIAQWWRENRPAAPTLVLDEFRAAVANLAVMPLIGRRVAHPEVKQLRRVLLRVTRYHVYYVANDELVMIVAVWSAVRGTGPDLSGLDLLDAG
jgi:plasmid stabilization system protein ParE